MPAGGAIGTPDRAGGIFLNNACDERERLGGCGRISGLRARTAGEEQEGTKKPKGPTKQHHDPDLLSDDRFTRAIFSFLGKTKVGELKGRHCIARIESFPFLPLLLFPFLFPVMVL